MLTGKLLLEGGGGGEELCFFFFFFFFFAVCSYSSYMCMRSVALVITCCGIPM